MHINSLADSSTKIEWALGFAANDYKSIVKKWP
jgi:hypothetical protein